MWDDDAFENWQLFGSRGHGVGRGLQCFGRRGVCFEGRKVGVGFLVGPIHSHD